MGVLLVWVKWMVSVLFFKIILWLKLFWLVFKIILVINILCFLVVEKVWLLVKNKLSLIVVFVCGVLLLIIVLVCFGILLYVFVFVIIKWLLLLKYFIC